MDYGLPVRFGVFITPIATGTPLRLATLADELGFDILGVQDHPYQRRFFDTMTLLTPGESVSALEEAIQVIRLLWSGQHGIRFDGMFYQLAGAHSGPVPAHPIGVWLGAYRPRMLSLVGRLADGWVPSYGYVKEDELREANTRIDQAARAAGRDPRAIRRVLNAGYMEAEQLIELVVDVGMDTFLVADEEVAMRTFALEVAPKVRAEVESRRSRRAD